MVRAHGATGATFTHCAVTAWRRSPAQACAGIAIGIAIGIGIALAAVPHA